MPEPSPVPDVDLSDCEESEGELIPETDSERRTALVSSGLDEDLRSLKSNLLWEAQQDTFKFTPPPDNISCDVIDISDSEDEVGPSNKRPQHAIVPLPPKLEANAKKGGLPPEISKASLIRVVAGRSSAPSGFGLGKLVQSEIEFRKKESSGMAPTKAGGRTLGGGLPSGSSQRIEPGWECKVCTL